VAESVKSSPAERVLIVEDDTATRVGLTELIRTWGFAAEAAANGEEALALVTSFRPAIVVSDVIMPKMNGLELLRALKDEDHLRVILLTAQGTVETAVEAVKDGAEDYLTKPVDPAKLRRLLERITELNAQKRENLALRRQLREKGSFGRIIGNSPKMRKIYQVIEQAADTPASVLIIGESGTGKELVAQTIHQLSSRAQAPFVAINCAAIPETLLESEIFGHEKGSFTGAIDRRAGCFELADHGTLFLDEIAEMMPTTQVKLLRVLQERTFRRLGGRVEQEVDVRVLAATNVNPADAIRDSKLREDLYYRLNVFTIDLPPLRDRKVDLLPLARALLERIARDLKRGVPRLTSAAEKRLEAAGWRGNVRELANTLERAAILADGEAIDASHIWVEDGVTRAVPNTDEVRPLADLEREAILHALDVVGGNRKRAAELLGIGERTLYDRLKKYDDD
jgi:DNA-binding NtrC family response regulator